MLEVAALRRQDIDLANGIVRVTDTGFHKPKTAASNRIIPVCSEVLNTLSEWMDGQKVIPASGELFLTRLGTHWTEGALSHRWSKMPIPPDPNNKKKRGRPGGARFQAAKETGIVRLGEVQPHGLRSAFATMAGRLGVPDRLLKSYLGHVPGDVLGVHYRKITLAEMGLVSSRTEGWRNLVDGESVWQHSGNHEEAAIATG